MLVGSGGESPSPCGWVRTAINLHTCAWFTQVAYIWRGLSIMLVLLGLLVVDSWMWCDTRVFLSVSTDFVSITAVVLMGWVLWRGKCVCRTFVGVIYDVSGFSS